MKRKTLKYLNAVLLLMLAMLPAACSDEGNEPEDFATSFVTFRVVTPRALAAGVGSRAIPDTDEVGKWNDAYIQADGVDFDNALIGDQFNVFITDASGTELTKLINMLCFETTDVNNNMVYSFSGEIPKEAVENLITYSDARIHIAANCGSGVSLTGGLSYSRAGQPSETFTSIPMWGVGSFDFTELKPGYNDAGEIWLLRAMAKVEIMIDPDVDGNLIAALNSASVTGTNLQGYVLPKGWNSVGATESLSFIESLNSLSSAGNISGLTAADNKIVFYLPETANTAGSTEITLNYTTEIVGNESKSNVIQFARYSEGKPTETYYDIVRNHLYQFKVALTGSPEQLVIRYTVCPWQTYEVNPPAFD